MASDESLDARIDRIKSNPNTINNITTYVSNGGTLASLCEVWDVPYGAIASWLNLDANLSTLYAEAVLMREQNTKDKVLAELATLAFADIAQAFNPDGSLKPFTDMSPMIRKAIAAVEVDELFEGTGRERAQIGFTKRIKFWDKNKAIEMLGKTLAMFKDVKQISADLTLEQLLSNANEADKKLIK